jgi:hypothetical protein
MEELKEPQDIELKPMSIALFNSIVDNLVNTKNFIKYNIDKKINTEEQIVSLLPDLVFDDFKSLHKMLIDCGKVKRDALLDSDSLKIIVRSIVRMLKSLKNKDAIQGIREVVDDLANSLTAELSTQISQILHSMSSEIESF